MKAFTGGRNSDGGLRGHICKLGSQPSVYQDSPPHPAGKAASASEVCPAPRRPLETFPAVIIYWLSGNTRTLIRAEDCERSYGYFFNYYYYYYYYYFPPPPRLTLSLVKNSTNKQIATESLLALSQRRARGYQSPGDVSVRKQLAVNRSRAQGKWQPSGRSRFLLPAPGRCQNKNNT